MKFRDLLDSLSEMSDSQLDQELLVGLNDSVTDHARMIPAIEHGPCNAIDLDDMPGQMILDVSDNASATPDRSVLVALRTAMKRDQGVKTNMALAAFLNQTEHQRLRLEAQTDYATAYDAVDRAYHRVLAMSEKLPAGSQSQLMHDLLDIEEQIQDFLEEIQ
jgi:hypothetical protein